MAVAGFRSRVERALDDDFLRVTLPRATRGQFHARQAAWAQLAQPDAWRERARQIRARTLADLDRYLTQMADRLTERGGRVHWAADGREACAIIEDILQRAGARRIVKSKSMLTEEIGLNQHLLSRGFEVVETDLGEYILQLAGEPPSHIVAPAIHKSGEQVRAILSREAGRPLPPDARALTDFARGRLRARFLAADAGISGANFVVAETGHVVLVTNEGNGRMVSSLPPVHIAVMGMERVVPTWEDLGVLLELLARSATGQKLTVYTSLVGGVSGPEEADGPREFHLVVVDNGRSAVLGSRFREVLHCIRCGACLNACPVYRQIGGHAYGSVYSGPIGAVITPLLDGLTGWEELPQASSLCGACHEACPVKIPLHDLLIDLRDEAVRQQRVTAAEAWAFRLWSWLCAHPTAYRLAARLAYLLQRPFARGGSLQWGPGPLSRWLQARDFPALARQPFHRRWPSLARQVAGRGGE